MAKKLRAKRPKQCWVYVLQCGDGSYYTGWTNDLERRLQAHQRGKGGKYTRSRLPVRLAVAWKKKNSREARRDEVFFKQLSRTEKVRALKETRRIRSARVRPRADAGGPF